jgi:hypothetical protein
MESRLKKPIKYESGRKTIWEGARMQKEDGRGDKR